MIEESFTPMERFLIIAVISAISLIMILTAIGVFAIVYFHGGCP